MGSDDRDCARSASAEKLTETVDSLRVRCVQSVDLLDGALLFSEMPSVPLVAAQPPWRHVSGKDVFVADGVAYTGRSAPHPDLYLHARRLDPNNPDEIARF